MKTTSNSTINRTTSAACFRAVATGVGNTIGQSKATGEMRKALVRTRPGTIAEAPANEGFAAETGSYGKSWHGAEGDVGQGPGSGFLSRGPGRTL